MTEYEKMVLNKKKTKLFIKNNNHYQRNRNTNIITTAETMPTETHFVFLKKNQLHC